MRYRALLHTAVALACLAAGQAAVARPEASAGRAPKGRAVKVYLYRDRGAELDLAPVTRRVSGAAPTRGALEPLLGGPTPDEERKGFGALVGAGECRIGSLVIRGATARVNFVTSRTWAGWPGDLAPARFKMAVELTLKQFPGVRRVVVSLDGDPNFYSER